MTCRDCGGIIVFQGCNSMQKILNADFYDFYVPWKIFMCFVVFSAN